MRIRDFVRSEPGRKKTRLPDMEPRLDVLCAYDDWASWVTAQRHTPYGDEFEGPRSACRASGAGARPNCNSSRLIQECDEPLPNATCLACRKHPKIAHGGCMHVFGMFAPRSMLLHARPGGGSRRAQGQGQASCIRISGRLGLPPTKTPGGEKKKCVRTAKTINRIATLEWRARACKKATPHLITQHDKQN
jgi:hypothetical protein